ARQRRDPELARLAATEFPRLQPAGERGDGDARPADAGDRRFQYSASADHPPPLCDRRAAHRQELGEAMPDTSVAIIGAGIGGVYLAAELGMLGCRLRL